MNIHVFLILALLFISPVNSLNEMEQIFHANEEVAFYLIFVFFGLIVSIVENSDFLLAFFTWVAVLRALVIFMSLMFK